MILFFNLFKSIEIVYFKFGLKLFGCSCKLGTYNIIMVYYGSDTWHK